MKKLALAAALLCASGAHAAGVNVLMHHNDTNHTGANLLETQLTASNVNSAQFGKLWDYEVDSEFYAQPLIVQNVTIPGLGTHDLVIVATMNNTVYAFDADNNLGANVVPLWQTNFNDPAAGIVPPRTANIFGSVTNVDPLTPVGIMSTPVIDPNTNTIYVVSRTSQNGTYGYQLHALDLTTGADRNGSPVSIAASVPGTGYDAVNGIVTFNPQQEMQRDALGLANNQVVIAWGSQGDIDPYHGWVMTYDKTTLQQTGVFNTTPTGAQGGIWQSGDGPSVDANGYVYYTVGNGTFDGAANFGQSVLKFNVTNGIGVQSFFAPANYLSLNQGDLDLGVSGPLLIPGTSLLLNGSKTGDLYLLNTGNLGGEVPGNTQIPQTFTAAAGHIHGSPVYYPYSTSGPLIYIWSESDSLKAFHFNGSTLGTSPVTTSSFGAPPGMPGGVMSISANGSQGGTGVVWASIPLNADAESAVVSGVLRAFDASNLSTELYDTQKNAARDSIGLYSKYTPPTVANGKVYMATFSNKLRVYGLLASQAPGPKGSLTGSSSTATGTVNLSSAGSSDWAHWPGYVHKATGGAQISDLDSLYPPYATTTYSNDQRTFAWSDGTPAPTGSVTTGVSVSGWAGGYQISAPADTNPRTLTVYVGGFNSAGHLRAYLSDGSAEDFVATTSTSGGNYYIAYTFTYTAGQSGQLLYVQWTQASSSGNVTIAGATLSGGSGPTTPPPTPTGISATQGTSTTGVLVSWSADSGATGYTIYRSTVAGTQGAVLTSTTGTSFTDVSAVPGTTYYYSIAATNSVGSSAVSAQVSGYVPVGATGGALSGVGLGTLSTANLTTVGTSDWAHWPEFTQKTTGGSQISNYTRVGTGQVNTYGNATLTLNWSDGKPTATGNATTGSFIAGLGNGFQITVPADTNTRQVTVYVGGWSSTGKLTAHLSDGSAADFSDSSYSSANAIYQANYTLTYHAASAGQTLTITWTMASGAGNGNVVLDGAALAGGTAAPTPPATPTGLSATQGTSTTAVTVSWTAVSGATGYTLYRSTASGTQGSVLTTTSATTYPDTSAVAGTTYYYSVAATNAAGASSVSAQISGYVAASIPPPPATPTGLSATQGTSTTAVTVSWTAVSGATGYTLYRSTASGTQGPVLGTTATTSYPDTSAVAGTTYYYSVAATNSGGASGVSAQVSGYVGASTTGALSGVGLGTLSTANLTTVGSADWAHWPEFTQKVTGGSQISNFTLVGTGQVNTYGDATLTLTWSDGNRAASGSATTGSFVAGVGNGFQLTVPADTNTRQITVYVGGWASKGKLTAHLSDGSAADFTDSSYSSANAIYQANYTLTYHAAAAGQTLTITWTMASGNSNGNVVLDGAALAGGTAAPTPPATPTGLSATQGTSTTAVTVSWTAVSGATGYTVYRSTASGTQGSVLGTTATTSYPDTSAVAGTTYYYSVAATNTAGASSVSAQVSGYVAASTTPPPATPTGLSATQGTSTTAVTVSWTAVSGATGYTVYRSTASGSQGSVLGTTATASYPDTSAVAGTTYYYSVAATNSGGASSVSAQVSGYVAASTPPPPATPTGLSATQGTSTTTVTVSWTAVSGATGYTVYRSTASGSQGSVLGTTATASYPDNSAVAGTTYYYSVVATNSGGASSVSAQASGYVAASSTGALSGVGLGTLSTANLTTVGTSDWAHWPEFTQKTTGGSQISNYTRVGTGQVNTYGNATLTLNWSDGKPTATGNATTGSFIAGLGNGFQITVPADTNTRQVTVYVGGWSSTGKLTAHLSDGSAADFTDSSYSSANAIYQANYTLTYHAASAGQTLTITWTMASGAGNGNVVLDGAALAGGTAAPTPPATPTGLSATQGTSTTAVTVSWTAVSGATGYTLYRSTASGTQGPVLSTTATTSYPDTSAVAGTTYYYSVAATNSGGASGVSAQVSGYVGASTTGALSGVGLGTLSTANLTTVGSADWAHWPEFTQKVTGGSQISNFTLVGTGQVNTYGDATLTLTWSDGNRAASGSATTGSFVAGVGNGFQLTVPADTNTRQITVYVGGWASKGKLTAHLSDGSAADFTDSSYSSANAIYQANYTLTYHAAAAGQTLTITWTMASGNSNGNVVLDGAALAGT